MQLIRLSSFPGAAGNKGAITTWLDLSLCQRRGCEQVHTARGTILANTADAALIMVPFVNFRRAWGCLGQMT